MKNILVFILLFNSVFAKAADLKTKDDVIKFAEKVQAIVAKGEIVKAMNTFKPYIIVPESEFNVSVEQLKLQIPMIDQRFGKTIGSEFIAVEEQGESLLLFVFLQKFENHAMRWRLYFYKSKSHWVLNTYLTDDQIHTMFNY